jgi:hypothetical protein
MSSEYSIVLESYNLSEGASRERLRKALSRALMLVADGDGEVLLADTDGEPNLLRMLAEQFPQMRQVDAQGLTYDEAKNGGGSVGGGEIYFVPRRRLPGAKGLAPTTVERSTPCSGASRVRRLRALRGRFLGGISVMDRFSVFSLAAPAPMLCFQ